MSEIKTWKERLQNPIYGYPEEMQCREDEVDELRTRIYQLEQELAAALASQAQQETVTVQQAWEWAGGNPETKATRQDLEEALKLLDEICEEADKTSQAQQPSCTYTWNCPRCGSGKCIDESDASQAQQPEYTFDQLTKMMMQAATKEGHKVTMKIKLALPPAPEGGE